MTSIEYFADMAYDRIEHLKHGPTANQFWIVLTKILESLS